MPSGPSTATVKRLFAVSSNRCAFPPYGQLFVPSETAEGRASHVPVHRRMLALTDLLSNEKWAGDVIRSIRQFQWRDFLWHRQKVAAHFRSVPKGE